MYDFIIVSKKLQHKKIHNEIFLTTYRVVLEYK